MVKRKANGSVGLGTWDAKEIKLNVISTVGLSEKIVKCDRRLSLKRKSGGGGKSRLEVARVSASI